MLAKCSRVIPEKTVSTLSKGKRKLLVLCSRTPESGRVKLGSFMSQSCNDSFEKCKKRVVRVNLLFWFYKPTTFWPFSLSSLSSLLKLPIVVVQKFCYHGNVTSLFFSLFLSILIFILLFCFPGGTVIGRSCSKISRFCQGKSD